MSDYAVLAYIEKNMVDKIINGMIAGIIGAVAFIAVKALVNGDIYNPDGTSPWNGSNASAGELMVHDILPLALAIMVVAGLFMGLTQVRGV